MNPVPPAICGTLIAAMMAAGLSHFWSIEKFIANYPTTPAVRLVPVSPIGTATPETPSAPDTQDKQLANTLDKTESSAGKEFFESLIQEMRNLRSENKALTNQIAETNRDVMKMQFQIDTHSESFRPLPTSQERAQTSYGMDDDFPGVLPPRAEPVYEIDQ